MAACTAMNGLAMGRFGSAGLARVLAACLLVVGSGVSAGCEQQSPSKPSPSPATGDGQTRPADTKPSDTKPAETKPADTKPADAKPADAKPADGTAGASKWPPGWVPMEPANPALETTPVTIAGKRFNLEMALTDETRFHGLSGRTEIKEDGGMLFVFKNAVERAFVMRDCPIPIDILYLDGTGRIVSMYEMVPEPPRTEAERVMSPPRDSRGRPMNVPEWAYSNEAYEKRLKQYPSRFGTQFVVELRAGSIKAMGVKVGEKVELDAAGLKKKAK